MILPVGANVESFSFNNFYLLNSILKLFDCYELQ